MAVIRPSWLQEMARSRTTIGSDSMNFPQQPDEVITPDDRWNWRTHMKKPIPIPQANPYGSPSPLGAYIPEEDEYIGGLKDHTTTTWEF